MEKMGTLKKNGDQKTNFGPHGDQSPQMGTNVGAVHNVFVDAGTVTVENMVDSFADLVLYFVKTLD